jgi:hypothetical protein
MQAAAQLTVTVLARKTHEKSTLIPQKKDFPVGDRDRESNL